MRCEQAAYHRTVGGGFLQLDDSHSDQESGTACLTVFHQLHCLVRESLFLCIA
jgi:hypothetical protein